ARTTWHAKRETQRRDVGRLWRTHCGMHGTWLPIPRQDLAWCMDEGRGRQDDRQGSKEGGGGHHDNLQRYNQTTVRATRQVRSTSQPIGGAYLTNYLDERFRHSETPPPRRTSLAADNYFLRQRITSRLPRRATPRPRGPFAPEIRTAQESL